MGGYRYIINLSRFELIPGSPIAYWVCNSAIDNFKKDNLDKYMITREGMTTADNDKFLRLWYEIIYNKIYFTATDYLQAIYTGFKWFPYNKGGDFRRWYGNNEYVIDWESDGKRVKNNIDPITGRIRSHNYNGSYSFFEGITWTELSSGLFSARYTDKGFLFDSSGAKAFVQDENLTFYIMGLLNSNVVQYYFDFINPTIHYKPGYILQIPFIQNDSSLLAADNLSKENISLSKEDWDSFETSWDFKKHPLI